MKIMKISKYYLMLKNIFNEFNLDWLLYIESTSINSVLKLYFVDIG